MSISPSAFLYSCCWLLSAGVVGKSHLQHCHSLLHSTKNVHCCENCRSAVIHHSNHHALIWFRQKFQFYCRFILLQWSVFISALTLLQCQSPHTHRGKWSLCQEIISLKNISPYKHDCYIDVFLFTDFCPVSGSFHARSETVEMVFQKERKTSP